MKLKLICFYCRYRTPAWHKKSLEECAPEKAEKEAKAAAAAKAEELRIAWETKIEQGKSTLGDLPKPDS
jgi:hypothetical protein